MMFRIDMWFDSKQVYWAARIWKGETYLGLYRSTKDAAALMYTISTVLEKYEY